MQEDDDLLMSLFVACHIMFDSNVCWGQGFIGVFQRGRFLGQRPWTGSIHVYSMSMDVSTHSTHRCFEFQVVMRTTWPPLLTRTRARRCDVWTDVLVGPHHTQFNIISVDKVFEQLATRPLGEMWGPWHRHALGSPLHPTFAYRARCAWNRQSFENDREILDLLQFVDSALMATVFCRCCGQCQTVSIFLQYWGGVSWGTLLEVYPLLSSLFNIPNTEHQVLEISKWNTKLMKINKQGIISDFFWISFWSRTPRTFGPWGLFLSSSVLHPRRRSMQLWMPWRLRLNWSALGKVRGGNGLVVELVLRCPDRSGVWLSCVYMSLYIYNNIYIYTYII